MLIKIAARNSNFPCMLLSALFFNNSEFYVICAFAKRFFENVHLPSWECGDYSRIFVDV